MQPPSALLLLSASVAAATLMTTVPAFQVGSQGRVMWENNCDFYGNDRYSVRAGPDGCGDLCANDGGCTHWTWTNYNGGTCWLKNGRSPTKSGFNGAGCGYVIGRSADANANGQMNSQAAGTNGLSAADTNEMLRRINEYRAQANVAPLTINPLLTAAAYAHSLEQAQLCKMDHMGADGSQFSDRITAEGYRWSTVAENVAAGQMIVDTVMTAWFNSPGHRANMLNPAVSEVGFAKGVNNGCSNYQVYWTQDFGSPA